MTFLFQLVSIAKVSSPRRYWYRDIWYRDYIVVSSVSPNTTADWKMLFYNFIYGIDRKFLFVLLFVVYNREEKQILLL